MNITHTDVKIYTHNEKKLIVKRIGDIKNKKCYIKIFKIIHGENFKYTKNDNGVFFNLTNISDQILISIDQILIYYENKKNNNEMLMKSNNINSSPYNENSNSNDII